MNAGLDRFMPPRGMANPHMQTIISSVARRLLPPKEHRAFDGAAQRQVCEIDGVRLAVDLNVAQGKPLVVIIPGWLGSSQSSYVRSAGSALTQAGYAIARINLRDHGDTAHLNEGLFNSAMIEEVIALVRHLVDRFGTQGASLLGYSLGGNFALRIARAMPELPTLAVAPAISPATTMYRIDSNLLYQRYFVRKWRKVWLQKQAAFPDQYDFGDALKLNSVSALTDYFVRYHSPFSSTQAYFAEYDLADAALNGVDAHILAAHDDPIIPTEQYAGLPRSVTIDLTDHGGHGAYVDSWALTSWADKYAARHFEGHQRSR
jgi:predicted alpha/beta-fold hydrolase